MATLVTPSAQPKKPRTFCLQKKPRFTAAQYWGSFWKAATTAAASAASSYPSEDSGVFYRSIEFRSSSPAFRIRNRQEKRYPECVVNPDHPGPILEAIDPDTDVGDKKHMDCIRPRGSTAVVMSTSARNPQEFLARAANSGTPGPGAYSPEDGITRSGVSCGVLPRGKRISCFELRHRDHRSVDFCDAPTMYTKPRAPTVSFSRAHLNTGRYDMPCPTKPRVGLDSAGPIYNPSDKWVSRKPQVAKIGTEERSSVNPFQQEHIQRLDRIRRSRTSGKS
eukprot:RCo008289